jgi:hypothetical protein
LTANARWLFGCGLLALLIAGCGSHPRYRDKDGRSYQEGYSSRDDDDYTWRATEKPAPLDDKLKEDERDDAVK